MPNKGQNLTKFYTSVFKSGNSILYRGYNKGRRVTTRETFSPTLYTPTTKVTGFESIYGGHMLPRTFDTMKEAKEYQDQHSDIPSMAPHGNMDMVAQFIQEKWPDNIRYDQDLINVVSLDIEVHCKDGFPEPLEAKWPVNSLTVKSSKSDTYFVWSLYDFDPAICESGVDPKNIVHVKCENDIQLLLKMLTWWEREEFSPDIITGWYSKTFDIPYLVNRIERVLGTKEMKRLSPWKSVNPLTKNIQGKDVTTYKIGGIAQIDLKDCFQKPWHTYGPQESYKLDHISHVVLGERKLDYADYDSLHDLAEKDPQKFVSYNIKDVQLVQRIMDKTNLMSVVIGMAYQAGINFEDALGTIRMWDTIVYRELIRDKIVVQPEEKRESKPFEGAFVLEPIAGLYDWVMSFDLNSLYPNIMIQWNMSPETIIGMGDTTKTVDDYINGYSPPSGGAQAANGAIFSTEKQGYVPRILEKIYADRKLAQKEMRELYKEYEKTKDKSLKLRADMLFIVQMSKKIMINSCYGAFGNKSFRHFDIRVAEAITTTGQMVNRSAMNCVTSLIQQLCDDVSIQPLIAGDTDSIYFTISKIVDRLGDVSTNDKVEFADRLGNEVIQPSLDECFSEIHLRLNCFKPRMKMGREAIAEKAFWTAKKRYAMTVHDNEGVRYDPPKIKVTGLEAIKSTTPAFVRGTLKDFYKVVLTEDEKSAQGFVEDYKKTFYNLPIEDIAKNTGVSNIEKWSEGTGWKSGTPWHVKSAITFNNVVEKENLISKYPKIQSGDKIKILPLRKGNPIGEPRIGFQNVLPKELGLEEWVDKSDQFDKVFIKPVAPIFEACGWDIEESIDIGSFFG